jgi:hypothetical protein
MASAASIAGTNVFIEGTPGVGCIEGAGANGRCRKPARSGSPGSLAALHDKRVTVGTCTSGARSVTGPPHALHDGQAGLNIDFAGTELKRFL